jgi:S-adenosylmethionine hydrolase
MIVLFTDFGVSGPYVGQMKAVLWRHAPHEPVIDLFADAPSFDPKLSAYLLAAYANEFAHDTVFLCVVDPGVGNQNRIPIMARIDNRWYVGPHNGLFNVLALRAHSPQSIKYWEILWRPKNLSNSFHGRDLFAPVAAKLATGEFPDCTQLTTSDCVDSSWPMDLPNIIYIDTFGNAMTGIRAETLNHDTAIRISGEKVRWARTFSEVAAGNGFWYENANGLVEIAVNRGNADKVYQLKLGDEVHFGE